MKPQTAIQVDDPLLRDEPCDLADDELRVTIGHNGQTELEFASLASAERFFGTRVATTPEALRELVRDLGMARPGGAVPRRGDLAREDRNLVTTREFADALDCAESSVFEMLKLGLPSIKSPKLGRRILKAEALAWLQAGGASRSRTAKRLRKTSGGSRGI
jgi:hypothetical protein